MKNLIFFIVIIFIGVAGLIGWAMNIISICGADFNHITGLLIVRVIGIFIAPLGAVLGYF